MKNLANLTFCSGRNLFSGNQFAPSPKKYVDGVKTLSPGRNMARSLTSLFSELFNPLGTRLDVLQHDTRKYFTPNIVYSKWYSDTRLLDIINLQTRHCENPNFRNLTSRRQTFAKFCRDIIFDIKKTLMISDRYLKNCPFSLREMSKIRIKRTFLVKYYVLTNTELHGLLS